MPETQAILRIRKASQNNLQALDLDLPLYQLIAVTGVSGSGKSSLAFEVIAREGQRRFLETFPNFSRQYLGKMALPEVESIQGLPPVISLAQGTRSSNPRSTVGTLSDLYDHLRLLYARWGKGPEGLRLHRSLFSFNHPNGACPTCNGLGLEEQISLDKLVADPSKSLREGALAPTLPNGYTMYSQVTLEVMNRICQAHGFNVDIPWQDLSPEQQDVILNGSTRLKVPFGKHSLESRLKWTGIAAKPREEGYYKGMLPIMNDILRRDRNPSILRFAESIPCRACGGQRLRPEALAVKLGGQSIAGVSDMEISALPDWLNQLDWKPDEEQAAAKVVEKMTTQIRLLLDLGLGHLSLSRSAGSLSGGETQRIRLLNQLTAELSNVLYVFDEPSIGLHPQDNQQMIRVLRQLVAQGNTVVVVEHDPATILSADWLVDIGPGAGEMGGRLLFNGPLEEFWKQKGEALHSPTRDSLEKGQRRLLPSDSETGGPTVWIRNCHRNNLTGFDAQLRGNGLNVITGLSGAGKSSLMEEIRERMSEKMQVVWVDQKPIGRTPRSNPATYTGLATHIRDLLAKTPAAKEAGLKKGHFSFNNKGGRCETCQGAGRIQIGMHFLGNIDLPCGTCAGKRFKPEVLKIDWEGKNIFQILEMSVAEALDFFHAQPKLQKGLQTLTDLGLGYLRLGQPSTTLSGGEAQRIKLATELQKSADREVLYLLDEPTVGLHMADVEVLLKALRHLTQAGHTVVCIEHDEQVILQADQVLDLGPGRGQQGGQLLFAGSPLDLLKEDTPTANALRTAPPNLPPKLKISLQPEIVLRGVNTHTIRNIDVSIPRNKLTVVTGVSGSGKTSLVFDTLYAESQGRFTESLSTYARTFLRQSNSARLESASGLGPVVAVGRRYLSHAPRSTVATLTGLHEYFRLLFSRVAQAGGTAMSASHFSFNHQLGACPACEGLGQRLACDPERLVSQPEKSLWEGAMAESKTGRFYGDPHGQFLATLRQAAQEAGLEVQVPFSEMKPAARDLVLHGTGDKTYSVTWYFKNKTRSGTQQLTATWPGLCGLVDEEYNRKRGNKNIEDLESLMHTVPCKVCDGARLRPESLAVQWQGRSIADWMALSARQMATALADCPEGQTWQVVLEPVTRQLEVLNALGLGYLNLSRRADSLSGGEAQRVRLAGQFAAHLYGVTYVLDEPTIGLSGQEVEGLLKALRDLVSRGNTVVAIEHDLDLIRAADHLIELGPGAGKNGGRLLYQGKLSGLPGTPESVTAPFLQDDSWKEQWDFPEKKGTGSPFGVRGGHLHNLQEVEVAFPSGGLIAVTGPSGSGKSSLVEGVLYASARLGRPIGCREAFGLDQFEQVLWVDQSPLPKASQSTLATWLGWMDRLRKRFARHPGAKTAGLKANHFSHNHPSGRCPECLGRGEVKASLDFVGDLWLPCASCDGLRYRPEVLQVKERGLNIGQLLRQTVGEAREFWAGEPAMQRTWQALEEIGLSHLEIGQSLARLSGGEAQRLKLARALIEPAAGPTLYLLDEPSTGLHLNDLQMLVSALRKLVLRGHTVLYVEHHPELIGLAGQVVRLGPVGGPEGGWIVQD